MRKAVIFVICIVYAVINLNGCGCRKDLGERDEDAVSYSKEFRNPNADRKEETTPTPKPKPTKKPEKNVTMIPKITQPEPETDVQEPAEEASVQPEPEEKTAEGYILDRQGDVLYLDLENTGSRNYPGEGEERAVTFDISNAEVILINTDPAPPNINPINVGCTVSVTYYTENGKNIVTTVSGDADEKEPISYVSTGTIIGIEGNLVTLELTEGDFAGTTEEIDTASASITGELSAGSIAGVTYYIRNSERIAMSVAVGGYGVHTP